MKTQPVYGLMAEFDSTHALVRAAEASHAEGYRHMDAYTPFPVEGLAEAIGFHSNRVPLICLVGALTGLTTAFFLEWWPNVIGYPLNIGGKPFNSWPSFVPIEFELTILFAGLSTVFGMLALNGLPTPYHPVFNAPRFELATRDRFFLCIEAKDVKFDVQKTREFLLSLNPIGVEEVAS